MKESQDKSARAFAQIRIAIAVTLFAGAVVLLASGFAQTRGPANQQSGQRQQMPGSQKPDVVTMVGPVMQNVDLRKLPYIPAAEEEEEFRLARHTFPLRKGRGKEVSDPIRDVVMKAIAPQMPTPMLTFDGLDQNLACGTCLPPDSDGDVGSNHYIDSANSSIQIYDKSGNVLAGPITYNSFFSAMGTGTPCGNNVNGGDGIVFYDHMADRWVVSDFAFRRLSRRCPSISALACRKPAIPVAGGWYLYAIQVDPANPS